MAFSGIRGLSVFIGDIRNCQNSEQETLRVDKELGTSERASKPRSFILETVGHYSDKTVFYHLQGLTPYEKKNMRGKCFTYLCLALMWILVTWKLFL
ncbi:AP-2 complex subunit alpha-1 [Cajanus cajan]|uniref:AP-2 complex subunit alpha-1 n=1 Tax=Cajanus cajan TaxID=3821 RepID=UPI00098DB887|nr:AP-2 complex subunit alpha-1 [Cajanus cajan]